MPLWACVPFYSLGWKPFSTCWATDAWLLTVILMMWLTALVHLLTDDAWSLLETSTFIQLQKVANQWACVLLFSTTCVRCWEKVGMQFNPNQSGVLCWNVVCWAFIAPGPSALPWPFLQPAGPGYLASQLSRGCTIILVIYLNGNYSCLCYWYSLFWW